MINTNGFITKYIESCKEDCKLEKEIASIEERLVKPYDEIEKIKVMYNVKPLEAKKRELFIHKKDIANCKEYYWYRSIVDGIYNLLEQFGWKHSTEMFIMLRDKFGMNYELDEGFKVFYIDSISDISPSTILSKRILTDEVMGIYYEDYDGNWFSIPNNVDIDECLTAAQNFLKALMEEDLKQLEDEEYVTYLRLKEKYEGKDK